MDFYREEPEDKKKSEKPFSEMIRSVKLIPLRKRQLRHRKLLIIIDMQRYIIGIKRELEPKEVMCVLKSVLEKIKQYDVKDIIATRETIGDYCEGSLEWEIEDVISDAIEGATIINKPPYGSVELTKMVSKIARHSQLEIEMVGVLTERCVASNAILLKHFVPDANIKVDSSCCFGTDQVCHQAAIRLMNDCKIEVS